VHAVSHITGGGIAANVARVLPAGLHGQLDRPTWTPPPIFGLIGQLGGVDLLERERTFNEGLGMVAVMDPDRVSDGVRRLQARGVPAWVCGHVRAAASDDVSDATAKGGSGGSVSLVGAHP
jgi:phosphoribosylformylglycinamidine cyclo-ligase